MSNEVFSRESFLVEIKDATEDNKQMFEDSDKGESQRNQFDSAQSDLEEGIQMFDRIAELIPNDPQLRSLFHRQFVPDSPPNNYRTLRCSAGEGMLFDFVSDDETGDKYPPELLRDLANKILSNG